MTFKSKWKNFWKVKDQQNRNIVADIDLSELETQDERKLRLRSLWICHIVTFVFSLSFSIVFTGVFPYLQQVKTIPKNVNNQNKYYTFTKCYKPERIIP